VPESWIGSFESAELARIAWRLAAAAVLGSLIGIEREWMRKAAGLRTHTTVALASATFVLAVSETTADIAPVIQGVAAGVGFLGAGTILKGDSAATIQGLTTAATIWLTAGVGAAAGAGHVGVALISVVAALITLSIFNGVERAIERRN
jgi:putative Mg2+ transporter-C (MgtC) family protein